MAAPVRQPAVSAKSDRTPCAARPIHALGFAKSDRTLYAARPLHVLGFAKADRTLTHA
ncbi:MAG TPA: hypothetical protein VGN96_15650 [Roseococcus sp.]|nr:hypothetical protein [Roseococcus sp.]